MAAKAVRGKDLVQLVRKQLRLLQRLVLLTQSRCLVQLGPTCMVLVRRLLRERGPASQKQARLPRAAL